jgi:hypothetical protein
VHNLNHNLRMTDEKGQIPRPRHRQEIIETYIKEVMYDDVERIQLAQIRYNERRRICRISEQLSASQ